MRPGDAAQVFLSYAWEGESEAITDRVDAAMAERNIRVVRDKRDLGFKASIREFMQKIGEGRAVVVVVSDKYLKSKYCMFELIRIFRQGNFVDRIFPVLLPDARIYDGLDLIDYLKYWEDKRNRLEKKMRTIDLANQHGIRSDLDLYDDIRDMIGRLTDVLRDIVTWRPENLDELLPALVAAIGPHPIPPDPDPGERELRTFRADDDPDPIPPAPEPGERELRDFRVDDDPDPIPPEPGLSERELQNILVDDDPELIARTSRRLLADNRLGWARRFAERLLAVSSPRYPKLEIEAHEILGRIAGRRPQ